MLTCSYNTLWLAAFIIYVTLETEMVSASLGIAFYKVNDYKKYCQSMG